MEPTARHCLRASFALVALTTLSAGTCQ